MNERTADIQNDRGIQTNETPPWLLTPSNCDAGVKKKVPQVGDLENAEEHNAVRLVTPQKRLEEFCSVIEWVRVVAGDYLDRRGYTWHRAHADQIKDELGNPESLSADQVSRIDFMIGDLIYLREAFESKYCQMDTVAHVINELRVADEPLNWSAEELREATREEEQWRRLSVEELRVKRHEAFEEETKNAQALEHLPALREFNYFVRAQLLAR